MTARRRLGRIAGALALLASGLLLAPQASAAEDGACPGTQGVTVVVDFTDLGGDVVVRCAGVLAAGANGFQALDAAGFSVAEPLRTQGFVCRIDGRPGPGTEICVDTPPASAYWSYWSASRGGTWQYNSLGAAARAVPAGSVEGWSFAKDRAAAAVPAPRVTPPAPVATTVPAPRPTTPSPSSAPPVTGPPAKAAGSTTIRGQVAAPTATTVLGTGDPGAVATTVPAPAGAAPQIDPTATTVTSVDASSTTTDPTRQRVEVAAAAGDADPSGTSGTGAATAVAVVLVAALGAGAVAAARRRTALRRLDGDG